MRPPIQQVLQPTLQVAFALFLTSLLTFVRPINFSLACLSSVFLLVLHILLVQNFHVGTQLLSAASFLGTVWSGIAAAGIVVTITMQIPSRAGHIALLVILGSAGLALGCLVRVSARQFPLLFLQGTNLLMTFGMSIVLSFWAPSVTVLWGQYLANMLLAFAAAGLASVVSGLLVLPSLGTTEAMQNVITALNRAGQTSTMCVSILLAPLDLPGATRPGDIALIKQQQQQQQQAQQQLDSTDSSNTARHAAAAAHPAVAELDADTEAARQDRHLMQQLQQQEQEAALRPAMRLPAHQQQRQQRILQHQASLLLEDPLSPRALSSIIEQANQPGQWGLRSFLAANSAASAAAAAGQDSLSTTQGAPAPAADSAKGAGNTAGALLPGTSAAMPQSAPAAPVCTQTNPTTPATAGATAAPPAAADVDEEDWGHDSYEEDHLTDIVSVDANVQVSSMPAHAGVHSWGQPEYTDSTNHSSRRSGSSSSSSGASGGSGLGAQSLELSIAVGTASGVHAANGVLDQAAHIGVSSAANFGTNSSVPVFASHSTSTAPSSIVTNGQNRHDKASRLHIQHLLPCRHRHLQSDATVAAKAAATGAHGVASKGSTAGTPRLVPADLRRHPLVRLQRGVDQIRPLLQATRQLQAAVTVEQAGWVGLLVRYRSGQIVNPGEWQQLVDALEALVHRVAALESMLEGGHDHSSLAQLTSYQTLAATCGAVFAQAAALCGVVSNKLTAKLRQVNQQGDVLQTVVNCCSSIGNGSRGTAVPKPHKVSEATSFHHGSTSSPAYASTLSSTATAAAASAGHSSGASSAAQRFNLALCSGSQFDWVLAKQHLVDVLEYETQQYYTALVQAAKDRPFRLDPARSMTSLMFLCMLSMGVIEACQKLQDTAKAVLGCSGDGSALGQEPGPAQQVNSRSLPGTVLQAPAGAAQASAAHGQHSVSPKAAGGSRPGATGGAVGGSWLLLRTFLILDVVARLQDAFFHQLPAACKSRAAFKAQLSDRRFQAGFKAWLGATIALVVIAAAYTQLNFLGRNGPSIFMFGFMSLVFTMRERVESSMEMVIFRVGATVVGAGAGHLFMFHPATAYNPYILCAASIFFCLLLVPFGLGQFRLVVVLGLLTFASVVLCQYAGCCGAVGSVSYLVGRILATGGGSLFAMLLNRMLWPWRRNRWAMEEFSRALEIAVVSARKMYDAEYQHMSESSPLPADGYSHGSSGSAPGGQISPSTPSEHVVNLHAVHHSMASTGQHPTQESPQKPSATAAPAAGTAAAATLASRTPDQLQQLLPGVLMPVQISIARDTWVTWKKGALALTPSVPLMLLAVQQMVDALSALNITHKLLSTMEQPMPEPQQPVTAFTTGADGISTSTAGQAGTAGFGSSSNSRRGSGQGASAAQCVQWQQQLLLHELVMPIDNSFRQLLKELGVLVGLVGAHVRAPTDASRVTLLSKIQQVHDMRVSVSLEYIQLRNQRHRKMRQQLAAIWHGQHGTEHNHHLHQQHAGRAAHTQPGSVAGSAVTGSTAAGGSNAGSTGAAGGQASRSSSAGVFVPAAMAAAAGTAGGEVGGEAAGGVAGAAVVHGDCWCVRQHGFQHQVLSTVQYMAFVHALRRFFDRAVAVARCAADARF